ncbi:MAG: phosphoribosylanthranilate isomerase, partial [Clostridiales bacterium]|nr:phosphoribosylanthranilate isomerase [Clostridiales bacterium]
LKGLLDPGILSVGVFVNATPEEITGLARDRVIDLIQLHGGEDEETVRRVKAATGLPVIKAVRVASAADVTRWRASAADFLLLDNGAGGTGRVFDWSLLPPLDRPWFLAGGLREDNIPAALSLSPYCLDISSGAETGGVKDKDKIKRLVEMIRKG